jgi:lysozyme
MTQLYLGKAGLDLIKHFESCVLHAYLPTPNDVPTIGWGSTGPDIHLGMAPWSQVQCDARLANDTARMSTAVNALVQGCPTTQNQFDAMVSFSYNEGAQRLHDSFILQFHRKGNYQMAASYFSHYTTQAHVVLNGLVTRRKMEKALYLTP